MVLGEDVAALVGLVLAFIFVSLAAATGNPVFDAIGSIVIGVVLVVVSIFIAVRIKGLIVGRSAEEDLQEAHPRADRGQRRHRGAAERDHDAARTAGDARDQGAHDAGTHHRAGGRESQLSSNARIKAKFPEVAWCFVEPDVAD